MNIDQLKELIVLFNDSKISKMDLEFENIKIKLKKNNEEKTKANELFVIPKQTVETKYEEEVIVQEDDIQGTKVKSPIVGVYYDKRSPESEPFVNEEMHVEVGQVLCIVEAMKVMNEIVAPTSGKLIRKMVKNEEFVEFDQVLMIIE